MLRSIAFGAVAVIALSGAAAAQDWSLPPAFGTANVAAGFTSTEVPLVAGGTIRVQDSVGGNCYGFVADAPDYRLIVDPGLGELLFTVTAAVDTTLLINDPSGEWYCDDDSGGYPNPELILPGGVPGQYDIWVGTYSAQTADATLAISLPAAGKGPGQPDTAVPPAIDDAAFAAGVAAIMPMILPSYPEVAIAEITACLVSAFAPLTPADRRVLYDAGFVPDDALVNRLERDYPMIPPALEGCLPRVLFGASEAYLPDQRSVTIIGAPDVQPTELKGGGYQWQLSGGLTIGFANDTLTVNGSPVEYPDFSYGLEIFVFGGEVAAIIADD